MDKNSQRAKEINQIASMNLNDICDLRAPLCENDNR